MISFTSCLILLIGVFFVTSCDKNDVTVLSNPLLINIRSNQNLPFLNDSLRYRLNYLRKIEAEESYDYAVTLRNLSYVYFKQNQIDLGIHFLNRSMELIKNEDLPLNPDGLHIINEYVSELQNLNITPSTSFLKYFITQISPLEMDNNTHLYYALNTLISTYLSDKKYDHALYYMQWKLRYYQDDKSIQKDDLHTLLYDLALLYYQTQKYEMAKNTLKFDSDLGHLNIENTIKIEILNAKIARKEKGILRSVSHYKKAEALSNPFPLYLDMIYFGLAENYFILRKHDLAEKYILKSLTINKEYYGSHSPTYLNRQRLLEKIYDFSKQYDKLDELEKRIQGF